MRLVKLSLPSWDFASDHLTVVRDMLSDHVCDECKEESTDETPPLVDYIENLPTSTQIDELLSTPCGAEYIVNFIHVFEFLEENNCYYQFLDNFYEQGVYDGEFDSYLEDMADNLDDFIFKAFTWHETPEGETFWVRLDDLWTNS